MHAPADDTYARWRSGGSAQLTEKGADVADQFVGAFHGGEVSAVVDVGPAGHVVLSLRERPDADVVGETG